MKPILLITTVLLILTALGFQQLNRVENVIYIGILQTASHPALDCIREVFKKSLQEKIAHPICFIEHNGMGQANALHSMAHSLHRDTRISLILTIGTPATQMMVGAEAEKWIIFAAVTDPSHLDLNKHPNLYGVSDAIDENEQVDVLLKLMPNLQSLAIVYNPAERNSLSAVTRLIQALSERSITYKLAGIQSPSEIPAVVANACRNCQLILTPSDNLVALSMPIIAKVAASCNKPVIASDTLLCGPMMAAAAFGIDYTQCGLDVANLAYEVLEQQQIDVSDATILKTTPSLLLDECQARNWGLNLE